MGSDGGVPECYFNPLLQIFLDQGRVVMSPRVMQSEKEERCGCCKVNQEVTIKFSCCLVEVFRMCFLYIFIRP